MSIGEKFATRNEVEILRRKILRPGIVQHGPDTEVLGDFDYRITVEEKNDDYVIVVADFGNLFLMNSAAAKIFTLPAVVTADVGLPIALIKRGAGKLTIQAGGSDTIQDSTAGGTLYNDLAEETFALVRLRVIAAATWVIEFFTGSGWRTS